MTENTENAAGADNPKLAEPNPLTCREVSQIKVKSERPDDEVEAKLRALNAKFKAEALASQSNSKDEGDESTDGSDDSSSADDKKAIEPVKSSNEILAELFGVFNAAPPEELLDDKNLLKKKKKVKKEKKEKKAKKKKSLKSDGECSDSDAEGKHKHKRKKHKHKHKDDKDKDKEKLRDKSREKAAAPSASSSVTADAATTGKEKEKSENRKRSAVEPTSHLDSHSIKRERQERERDRRAEREQERERERDRERQREREREREKERARSNNSFYNGHQESDRSKGYQAGKTNSRQERDLSDVSLSDEDTYLREKASNGRQRPHNSFYDGNEEAKPETRAEPKTEIKRHGRETDPRRRRRTRSRSRSRDLGIDKKRLLEIARKNAISMFKRGTLPGVANMTPEVKDKVLVKMRYGGRTVQDLTDFCKKISKGDGLSDLSSDEDSDVDKNGNAKAFHHPFQLKEREPIVMHIRNSTPIVPATSLREEQTKAITMQFPVSSGQTHRMNEVWVPVESKDKVKALPALPPAKQATNMFKETPMNVFAKPLPQQDQQEPAFKSVGGVPLPPSTVTNVNPAPAAPKPVPPPAVHAKDILPAVPLAPFVPEVPIPSAKEEPPAPSPSIFPEIAPPSMDVSSIITQRLSAIRRLQDNPGDSEALKMMYHAQRNMSSWANSKHLPGQFTGSTGAQVMKAHELNSGPQLWVRKDQLTSTKPVTGGMGMALLQKMGWKPGEGLGRCKTGSLQPLLLDVKLDKRGLVSREDLRQQPAIRPNAAQRRNKNTSGHFGGGTGPPGAVAPVVAPLVTQDKHPVCVLNELSSKNKWTPPQYTLRQDTGPPHCRLFLFSVEINGQSYTPERGCLNKKEAKLNAAQLCLRALGILPPS